ncbi:CoA transferase [Devosia naphthalenivorans]|uniref:CoA transferase n=1 Tax=Devosia naphthalenivorans TaxID=2082392 RepID=UPI000D3BB2B8|nr:CoA transferase [Devosia naphthalenivorans]
MLLEGLSVIEWSDDLASQFASRLLGDLGAQVLKFEPPGGSVIRKKGPMWPGQENAPEAGILFDFLNAGKICRSIDPQSSTDVAIFERALAGANVLVQSGLDAAFASGGLSVSQLRDRFPQLVVVSITPFGVDADAGQYQPMSEFVLQHHVGVAHAMARPVSNPEAQPPLAAADHEGPLAVGVCGALAAAWGLLVVQAGGKAPQIDLASQDFYAQVLLDDFSQFAQGKTKFSRDRKDNPNVAPAGGISWLLPAQDGFIMVSPREEHQWQRWLVVLDHPAWAGEAALCGSVAIRKQNWAKLRDLMGEWSRRLPAAELAARAQKQKVACFPVSTPAELLKNAQLHHRRFFDLLVSPGGGAVRIPGLPFQIVDSSGRQLLRERVVQRPRTEALESSNYE